MTLPGAVDARTGNVPFVIYETWQLHFDGCEEQGGLYLRCGRASATNPHGHGPRFHFHDAAGVLEFVAGVCETLRAPVPSGLVDWLETRLAEPVGAARPA